MKKEKPNEQLIGIISATGAYILWGILPVYWKLVQNVPPFEILAHRVIWSFVFLALVIFLSGRIISFFIEVRTLIAHKKRALGVLAASVLVTANWLTYIWAVNNNHIVESSLGYYINPLVSVLLGIIVLKEKLSFWQTVSFVLATIGVLNITVHYGSFPWIALTLATSFGLYGLIKKMVNLGAITGIALETLLISPFMLAYLGHVHLRGNGAFGMDFPVTSGLLMGAGVITAIPLVLFSAGATRLPLSVIGFLQYIAPTLMLVFGVFLYHEPFTRVHLVSFIFIWTALAIFSLSRTGLLADHEPVFLKKALARKR